MAWVAALLAGAACHFGGRAETATVAQTPRGAPANCVMNERHASGYDLRGELLAVTDSGLIVWSVDRTVFLARNDRIRLCTFESLPGDFDADWERVRDPEFRARLRLAARFPQGLTASQLAALLVALQQRGVELW
ncbi:MAG: hypothetical protein ACHQU1_02705 [Gemmatimonadales bacterium]